MTEAQAYVASPPKDSRRWWILIVMCIAQLMVILDATIVNIALPSAQRALHFTNADRQWIITAYALAFGSLLLIGGRLTLGRKQALLIASPASASHPASEAHRQASGCSSPLAGFKEHSARC